jgi:hypothetical protein
MNSLLLELIFRLANKTKYLFNYYKYLILGLTIQREFSHVRTFCLFVGYGRSGHTLIAALLNAHPEIVIGIEWDPLNKVRLGYKFKNQLFSGILENSKHFTTKYKNIWSGYSYQVNNKWQGGYKQIHVIGDKSGGLNTKHLMDKYHLLDKLSKIIGIEPKLIHVIRNPFDIITTTTIRTFERERPGYLPNTNDLLTYVEKFLKSAQIIQKLKDDEKYQMLDIYHEDIIVNPKAVLRRLIDFLGEEADDAYFENCAEIIFSQPHQSRKMINWNRNLIKYVEQELKEFTFLQHYKFDN